MRVNGFSRRGSRESNFGPCKTFNACGLPKKFLAQKKNGAANSAALGRASVCPDGLEEGAVFSLLAWWEAVGRSHRQDCLCYWANGAAPPRAQLLPLLTGYYSCRRTTTLMEAVTSRCSLVGT